MSPAAPPTFDDLRGRLLDRFRQSPRAVTEAEFLRLLDGGLYGDFRNFVEYWQQLRMIAAELTAMAPKTDPEMLAMLPIVLDRVFEWYQRSVLDLPNVVPAAR